MAQRTLDVILSGEETIYTLEEHVISRMLVCGWCESSNVDTGRCKEAFRKSVDLLLAKIDSYDEYGADPEVARIRARERGKAWREANAEYVKARRAERYRTEREQLTNGGNNGNTEESPEID